MTSAVRRAGLALGTSAALLVASVALGTPAQAANPTLRVFDATLTEGTGGQAIVAFAVQLSAKQSKAVTFTWGTTPGTAVAPDDFKAVPSGTTATIAKGATSTVLIVRVAADAIDEYTETFGVRLAGISSGVTLAGANAVATILDDDAPPVLSLESAPLVEGTDALPLARTVLASLSQVSGKPVSVHFAVAPGTAQIGSDLTGGSGDVVFQPGQLTADVPLTVVGDDVDEPNETFSLNWAAPINVQLPARSSARSLLDDDGPLRPAILGSTPPSPSPVDNPVLFGLAPALSTIEVYDNGTCAGSPIASGPADVFTSTGFAVPLSHNTTHTLTVKGTNTVGGADTQCSVTFTYRHDDIAPNVPSVIAVPGSPTQDPNPTVRGSAENGSTVNVYVDTDCSGTPVSTGTADDYGDADGLPLGTLTANTPHAVRVSATDLAGNVSDCSPPLTVTVDTVGPAAPNGLEVIPAAVTIDATPGLRGNAEAGSTVEVFVDNACTNAAHDSGSAATFASAGGISISPALSDGDHDLYARATDVAGNPGDCSAAEPVTIDTTAPDAPTGLTLLTGSPTSSGIVRVSGTAEPGTTVTIFRDSGGAGVSCDDVLGSGSAASFGDANGLTLPALDDGTYVLRARATDGLGQASACSSSSTTVVVDSDGPAAPTGLSIVGGSPTSDRTPALRGTAEAGSTVKVYADDATCSGTADATGDAADFAAAAGLEISTQLGSGAHTLRATATDDAGNEGACSAAASVVIDFTDPVITGFAQVGSSPTSDTTPTVTGNVSEAGSVDVFANASCTGVPEQSGSDVVFEGGLTITPALSEGSHSFWAQATDVAGNVGTCVGPVTIVIDGTPPALPTGLTVAGSSPTSDPIVGIRGLTDDDTTVTLYEGAGCATAVATGTATEFNSQEGILVTLDEGQHVLRAIATDAANLHSACSGSVTVVVDLTAPAAPTGLAVLPGSPTNDPTPALSGDAENGSQIHIWVDNGTCSGSAAATGTAGTFGGVSGIVLTSDLPEGMHLLRATATDAAGNESDCSAAEPVVIDLTKPAAPTLNAIAPAQDPNPSAIGSAETGSQVRAYLTGNCSGSLVAFGTASQFGSPGLALGPLGPGTYTASVEAEDDAGNVSDCSDPVTFDVLP